MKEIKITDVRVNKGDSAFLLDDGKTAILYDSGFAFTGFDVAKKIKKLLGDRPLDYIFLTHSHYDHALGAVYVAKKFPDVKIVASEYVAKIFSKPTARSLMRELDGKFAKKCGILEYPDLIDELHADITVTDGDIITAGDMRFETVALPGHTRCSVGFYCAENKLMLGCETLGVYGGEGIVLPSYLVGIKLTLDSIDKAGRYDIDNILVSHYGLLDRSETETYLENGKISAKQTADEIAGLLKNGTPKPKILEYFKEKFYHGYIREIYPVDAMELNTSITIDLVEKEMNDFQE